MKKRRIVSGALFMDEISDANFSRMTIYKNMVTFFNGFDVLACPTVGNMLRSASEEWVLKIIGEQLNGYMDWLRFAFLATTPSLPAISIPISPSRKQQVNHTCMTKTI